MTNLKFSEVKDKVSASPGMYEIYTSNGIALKVGIAKDLKSRLRAHGKSRQNRLKLKDSDAGYVLGNVVSKQSILAKHLYFDDGITTEYDLTNEVGRASYLENECFIKITYTATKEDARLIEKVAEASGVFRYVGRVLQR